MRHPLLLTALAVLLVGCGQVRAIEDRALILAVGIEPGRRNSLRWTFVVPNVTVTASSISSLTPQNQVYAVTAEAPTWGEALRAAQEELSRDVYLGQLEVLAVDRRLGRAEVARVLDAINEDGLIPKSFWFLATDVPPSQVLTLPTVQEVVPRYFFTTYFRCRTCHAVDFATFGWEWWDRHWTPGLTPVAPLAEKAPSGLEVTRIVVYRDGATPLVFPREASEGYAVLKGRLVKGVLAGDVAGTPVVLERVATRATESCRLEGDAVVARVRVVAHAILATGRPAFEVEKLDRIARWAAAVLAQKASAAVRLADASRTDPFGYTYEALAADPRRMEGLGPGDRFVRRLAVHVDVTLHLDTAGTRR
jgi:spore germination protein KC